MHPLFASAGEQAVPILFATAANFSEVTQRLDARERAFVRAAGFEAKAGRYLIVPNAEGGLACVLFGLLTWPIAIGGFFAFGWPNFWPPVLGLLFLFGFFIFPVLAFWYLYRVVCGLIRASEDRLY